MSLPIGFHPTAPDLPMLRVVALATAVASAGALSSGRWVSCRL